MTCSSLIASSASLNSERWSGRRVLDRTAEPAIERPDGEIEPEVREQEERGDQGKETF